MIDRDEVDALIAAVARTRSGTDDDDRIALAIGHDLGIAFDSSDAGILAVRIPLVADKVAEMVSTVSNLLALTFLKHRVDAVELGKALGIFGLPSRSAMELMLASMA